MPMKVSFSRDMACLTMSSAIKWSNHKETKIEMTNLEVISYFFLEKFQKHLGMEAILKWIELEMREY